MAEPARIYDPEDKESAASRPSLRALEGGSSTSGERPTNNPFSLVKPEEGQAETKPAGGRPDLQVLQGGLAEKEAAAEQPEFNYSNEDESGLAAKLKDPFGGSRLKKGIAAGTIILAGGSVAGILAFLSLTPLKVISMVAGLDNIFGAPAHYALTKETEAIENDYLRYVMRGLLANKNCHSSIDANCVANIQGKGPVKRALISLKDGKTEQWLATNRKIIVGKSGPNSIYLSINGQKVLDDQAMKAIMNGEIVDGHPASIFSHGTRYSMSEANIAIMDAAYRDATKSDKIIFRLFAVPLLKSKYGIRLCLAACKIPGVRTFNDTINGIREAVSVADQAFKGWVIQRVITPRNVGYGLMMQRLLDPQTFDKTLENLENPNPGEVEDLNPFQRQLQQQLTEALANESIDVTSIVQTSNDISKDGIASTVSKKIAGQIAGKFGSEAAGQTAGEVGAKAVPLVGWVLFAAQIISTLGKIGPALRVMSYAISAAADVQMYALFSTLASEAQSGHTTAEVQGSAAKELSTNLTGAATDVVDFTDGPLYGYLFGTGTPANSAYRCEDGKQVPADQYVCPSEVLNRGNGLLTQVSSITNTIPGLVPLASAVNQFNGLLGNAGEVAFDKLCATILDPSCKNAEAAAAPHIADLSAWTVNKVVGSNVTDNMDGVRLFDSAAGGDDVFQNVNMLHAGGAKLTDQQVADIRSAELSQDQADFESQPMFARIFSTDTPYSLVSRLAVVMPVTPSGMTNSLASLTSNPLGDIATLFSNVFAGSHAFAALKPIDDPFGVTQNGYLPSQIPDDPETYWDLHCQGDYRAAFGARQIADSGGQAYVTSPEPCLLIDQTSVGVGALNDPGMAPEGSMNPDPPAGGQ